MEEEYELVEVLSRELARDFSWRLWTPHFERVRLLRAPSVKLVYLYLAMNGPQAFTVIRRTLALGSRTVDKALKELLATGFVLLDDVYMYRIVYPPRGLDHPTAAPRHTIREHSKHLRPRGTHT